MKEEELSLTQQIQDQQVQIEQQNKRLQNAKGGVEIRQSMLTDEIQDVDYVDRKDWRAKGNSSSEEEETETEGGQTLEQANPLMGNGQANY